MFARSYVETHNASESYRRAYSTENMLDSSVWVEACKTKALPNVAQRIAQLQREAAERNEITVDRVAQELAKIAFANMADFMTVTEDGLAYIDLKNITRDQAAAIAELTSETYDENDPEASEGKAKRRVKKTRLKLSDKQGGLEKLGRHLGMFKDGLEISGKNGKPIEVNDMNAKRDLARWIAHTLTQSQAAKGSAEK